MHLPATSVTFIAVSNAARPGYSTLHLVEGLRYPGVSTA